MRNKITAITLVFVFVLSSVTIFSANTTSNHIKSISPAVVAVSSTVFFNNNFNMEYCSVDLADRKSNLNVRTWEGDVVGKLRHGTRVWVNEYSGEWARVSVKRGRRWVSIGWVDSTFLLC